MARDCNAELCPYWSGDGCSCREFGINPPDQEADWLTLPSASYYRETSRSD